MLSSPALGVLSCAALGVALYLWGRWLGRAPQRPWLSEQRVPEGDPEAQERALLWRVLDVVQGAQLSALGYLDVVAASGRCYRLHYGGAPNVQELGPLGQPVATLCIQQSTAASPAGQLAAQVLLLETDEAAFRRIARRSPYGPLRGGLL